MLVVVDSFSKFIWLYPTRSTVAEEVIDRLQRQSAIFGNPERIISDRGTAFTSNLFNKYYMERNIQHLLITTEVPRGNGQVERINKIVVTLLSCSEEWYKHVDRVQQCINNTPSWSTKYLPFRILTRCEMRTDEEKDM